MVVCARVEAETDAICRRCAFQHGKPRWTACWRHPVPSHPRICICHHMSWYVKEFRKPKKSQTIPNHPSFPSKMTGSCSKDLDKLTRAKYCTCEQQTLFAAIRHSATWRASCLSFGDLAPGVQNVPMTWWRVCPRVRWLQIHANPMQIQEILIIFSHFPIFGRFLDIWSILIFDQLFMPIFHHFSLGFGPILYGNPPRSGPRKVSMPTLGRQHLGRMSDVKVGSHQLWRNLSSEFIKNPWKNHLKSRLEANRLYFKLSQRFQVIWVCLKIG